MLNKRMISLGLAVLVGVVGGAIAYGASVLTAVPVQTFQASYFGGGNSPELAATSDTVAIAVVTHIGAARFNTPNGNRPPESELQNLGPKYYIYRPVTLRVIEPLKVNSSDKEILTHMIGGEAEGIRFVVEGTPQFKNGEKVLVMLRDNPGGTASRHLVQSVYHINSNGIAKEHESDHELPESVLIDRVKKAIGK